jgi:3-oxoacyl-[acyl-carrier protein] reductase
MDLGLAGRRFVVGGGSKGLGRAIAAELVAEGARVVVVSRDPAAAAAELGEAATPCAADLATPEGIETVVSAASGLGGIDGLLVNTGGPPPGLALDLTDEQWEDAYRSLLGYPIRLIRSLRPELSEGASILFVTSSSARVPIAGLDTSNVLRPGVTALVKCLALELAPRVRVNSIVPGRIDTERVRYLDQVRAERTGRSYEEEHAAHEAEIAMGRYGDVAEFGRVAAFLLSPAASYVTGAAVQVDGGYIRAIP